MSKLVPEIRFKEFSGEWEEKTIEDIFDILAGGDVPKENLSYIKTKKYNIPIISNGINEKSLYGWTNKAKINKKSITVSARGTIGWTNIQEQPFYPIVRLLVLTPKININLKYIYFYMKTIENNYKFAKVGIAQLTKPMIKEIKILIPPTLQEQQKIADTFSSLDNLIEAYTQKLELLKEHKKGLMQKLFPRDEKKVPEIRFKEFSGEWEEKTIKEIFLYKNGSSFEKNIINNGKYKLITLNSIDINGKLKNKHKTVNLANNFLNKNDLIMVLSDVAHGNFLGLTAIIPENNTYVLNQRMGALTLKTNDNIQFIRLFINYNQNYFKKHGHGSSQQNLSKNDILKFKILIPPTLQEQQKIADTFSSLDNLIEAQTKKIELLKEHKKALMQKMFVK